VPQQFTGEGPVSVTVELQAPRAAVWACLEDEAQRSHWWPVSSIEFERGGSVSAQRVGVNADPMVGTVDVLVPGHALGFVWSAERDHFDTSVLITLHSFEERTKLSVNELGFEAYPNAIERSNDHFEAWSAALTSLQAVLEQR